MSTRSNTLVEDLVTGEKQMLYRHCDGYLEGAGFDLIGYAVTLTKKKIFDVEDAAQWIVDNGEGYEHTESVHGDIEYFYVLGIDSKNSKISVKAYDGNDRGPEITKDLFELYSDEHESPYQVLPDSVEGTVTIKSSDEERYVICANQAAADMKSMYGIDIEVLGKKLLDSIEVKGNFAPSKFKFTVKREADENSSQLTISVIEDVEDERVV